MTSSKQQGVPEKPINRAEVTQAVRSFKLNAWLALATATYLVAFFLVKNHPEWSAGLKTAVSLAPVAPGLLYLFKGVQLLRTLDELQRRIQFEAWLFAAIGTVVVSAVINVCNAQGLVGKWPSHGLEVGGTFLVMFTLWCVGTVLSRLRYR